ncbi:MAG: hypothetical protein H8D26_03645 [Methanomicrobia archaeon]|nr:hypothetical protein [Methanomicrobia archaeon]
MKLNLFDLLKDEIFVAGIVVFFLVLLIIVGVAMGESWDSFTDEQIVEAIGRAENSIEYPYGVRSINTKGDKEYARRICLNSVRNGRARWIRAGRPDDLIVYIGKGIVRPKLIH